MAGGDSENAGAFEEPAGRSARYSTLVLEKLNFSPLKWERGTWSSDLLQYGYELIITVPTKL